MHSHSGDCKEIPANDGILQTLTDLGRNISEELITKAEELTRSFLKAFTWKLEDQSVDPKNSRKSVEVCLEFHLQKTERESTDQTV